MATQTRNAEHGKTSLFSRWMAVFVVLIAAMLSACGSSSDTRNTAKEATSGKYEILTTILSPIDGSVILFKADGTTDAVFTATHTGGTDPTEYTWTVQGPDYTSTVSGSDPEAITFFTLGPHVITVTVTDANRITGSDTIRVTLSAPGLVALITQPTTDVIVGTGDDVVFNAGAGGGTAPYTYTWEFPGGTPNFSMAQAQTVVYNGVGTFQAIVTVQDSSGNIARDSVTVTVKP